VVITAQIACHKSKDMVAFLAPGKALEDTRCMQVVSFIFLQGSGMDKGFALLTRLDDDELYFCRDRRTLYDYGKWNVKCSSLAELAH
jgi:hypothetical protein